jgi:SulP family sulfate permease
MSEKTHDTGFAWFPASHWIRAHTRQSVRLDLIAGLSLAAFVIPESLAYASLAQLPLVTGLYCYLVAGIAYAIFGSSRQLAVGPTSAMSLVIATSVVTMTDGDLSRALALASAVALMVAIISIAGRYIGLAIRAHRPRRLVAPRNAYSDARFRTPAIAALVFFARLFPGRPTMLVVVAAAILAMPEITIPKIHTSDIAALVPIALACFMLAYGETISVARSFAQKHGYDINPEQELTAIGAANIATGLAHGFPVAGGMSQTAVNDLGGASSPLSLVVTSCAIALTLLFFASLFHNRPEPMLAAIGGLAPRTYRRLRRLREASRPEFRIAMLAFAGVLFFGLLNGLLLAAAGSLVMLIAEASRPTVVVLGREPTTGRFVIRDQHPDAGDPAGALVVRSAGGWFRSHPAADQRSGRSRAELQAVVIDCSIVPYIDTTAGTALRVLARRLKGQGIAIALAELRDDVRENLKAIGAEQDLGPIAAHRSIEDCLPQRRPTQ